jgi:hypothetical protein
MSVPVINVVLANGEVVDGTGWSGAHDRPAPTILPARDDTVLLLDHEPPGPPSPADVSFLRQRIVCRRISARIRCLAGIAAERPRVAVSTHAGPRATPRWYR